MFGGNVVPHQGWQPIKRNNYSRIACKAFSDATPLVLFDMTGKPPSQAETLPAPVPSHGESAATKVIYFVRPGHPAQL
jgi:hypothetical protein